MKIRIIGGPGKDDFINEGDSRSNVVVYDVLFEQNNFSGNVDGLRKNLSHDPRNNMYNRIFYKYNIFDPSIRFSYNVDDGLFLGASFRYIGHGFRNEPWATRHTLGFGRALRTGSVFIRYSGEFNDAIGNNDLVVRTDIRAPVNITNFFGLGNNTTFNDNLGAPYFRARYNVINASILLRRQLQSWMQVSVGPTYQFFKVPQNENKGKFINELGINGLDPNTVYTPKSYLGGELALDINSRNNQVLPTRGFLLNAGVRQLFGINQNSRNLTQLRWDMSIIASFVPRTKIVFGTRFGWYHNIGNFEFPQANYLSGPDNLRGYRRDRFGGRTMVFNNTELRYKIGDISTYLFPGAIGLLVFHDIGRVWQDNEKSNTWHTGYGGGFWISPIQRFVITASIASSKEEKILPYFTFGFQF
jgi:outer membrane protein assembly factor BamA